MVLWEITLATAYFSGLKPTYRLALKMQRKLLSPTIRQFLHRGTRSVFDVALKVHLKIQKRDIEVSRNLGRVKPEAQIRVSSPSAPKTNKDMKKLLRNSPQLNNHGGPPKSSLFKTPSIAIMIKPLRPTVHNIQCRKYGSGGMDFFTVNHKRFCA